MSTEIEVVREGEILHVWMNRPEKRNALNQELLEGIADVFTSVATDYRVRAVVLGGRGRSFCAGVDLTEVPGAERLSPESDAGGRERRHLSQMGLRAVRAVKECEVPTVARIQGHAIGGGALVAVACDFRVMADDAVISIPEIDLAIPLTWGGTPLLIAEVGAARARELIMLGDRIVADDAVRIGLAHRAVSPDDLDREASGLAGRLAAKAETAMHMTKTQFRAYESLARLGDVSEADGDMLQGAIRAAGAGGRFPP
ncbi:MAG: enoyl-CoA hydratase/isomerase family protein [Actinobacteria bacterium ATB1]|nr:enoyl-CoA hydratase/isomerase family protein [Actinobacteria bacterium ATB1]